MNEASTKSFKDSLFTALKSSAFSFHIMSRSFLKESFIKLDPFPDKNIAHLVITNTLIFYSFNNFSNCVASKTILFDYVVNLQLIPLVDYYYHPYTTIKSFQHVIISKS